MRKSLFSILLAACVIAVVPSAASAAPARAAGDPGGGCSDNRPPYSRWGHGWWGNDGGGHYWNGWDDGDGRFGGRAYDYRCDSTHKGRVDRVMVAVERLRGSRCQRLFRSGQLGSPVDCSRTHWMRAQGTRRWHHHIPSVLPKGHYRLHRRAVDSAGNRERAHMRHLWIR